MTLRLVYIRATEDGWHNIYDARTLTLIEQCATHIHAIDLCIAEDYDIRNGPIPFEDLLDEPEEERTTYDN
jgi:hypothetical protein